MRECGSIGEPIVRHWSGCACALLLLPLDLDRDLARGQFLGRCCGQLEHAVLVRHLDIIGLHSGGQRDRTLEGTVADLIEDEITALFLTLFFTRAFSPRLRRPLRPRPGPAQARREGDGYN